MSRAKKTKVVELSKAPVYATYVAQRWPDGRVLNVENQMWRYFSAPLGPVVDALNYHDSMRMAEPLLRALEETVALTPAVRLTYRATAKSSFRHVHMLLINLPRTFVPAPGSALGDYHRLRFPRRRTYFRTLLFGVRLNPSDEAENIGQTIANVVDTFVSGGDPIEMFTKDDREVTDGMRRAGLNTPTEEEMAMAEGWWNQGKDVNIPILPHLDHLHVFTTGDSAETAARLVRDNPELKCAHWPDIQDSHTLSFATVREFFDSNTRMNFIDAVSPFSHWASTLVSRDAVAISVRGRVEPAAVTAAELRRQRRKYTEDINERYAQNKMSRADQEAMLQELAAMGSFYETGGTPTLIEASTIVVFSGRNERTGFDPTEAGRVAGVNLTALNNLQYRAMAETMIGSSLRVNPFVRDLPAQTIGYSGLPNLSRVGDTDGALLGFTEGDEQAAYIHPMAATDEDNLPAMLVVGQTGAGKALRLSTSVPVPCSTRFPQGRATIGDLVAGDQIFGRDGRPYPVLGLSEIDHAPELFRLRISDGQTLLADGNHQFVVTPAEGGADLVGVAVDLEVLDSLANTDPRSRLSAAGLVELLREHCVGWWGCQDAVVASLKMVDVGMVSTQPPSYIRRQALQGLARRLRQRTSGDVGLAAGELVLSVAEMRASGSVFSIAVSAPVQHPQAALPDDAFELGQRLAHACATDNPRVPLDYMCAGVEQRRRLWLGLCEARGDLDDGLGLQTAELATEQLLSDALRLARSLGFKASALRSSVVVGSPERLVITAIDPVSPDDPDYGPVRCLTVDSPDHTYLVEDFVVTHNSMTMNWFADQFVRMRTSLGELTPVVLFDPKALALDTPVATPTGWTTIADIKVGDLAIGGDGHPCPVVAKSRVFEPQNTRMYRLAFSDGQTLKADHRHRWLVLSARQRSAMSRASDAAKREALAARRYNHILMRDAVASVGAGELSTSDLLAMVRGFGVSTWRDATSLSRDLRRFGASPSRRSGKTVWWSAPQACAAMVERTERLVDHPFGEVLTTEELASFGSRHYAIEVPESFDLDEADLAVDPYLLGVWLGDGQAASGEVYAGIQDAENVLALFREAWPSARLKMRAGLGVLSCPADETRCRYGHADFEHLVRAGSGRHVTRCATCHRLYPDNMQLPRVNESLGAQLSTLGVLGNKHIPEVYMWASRDQRVALLQGLMDSDGTVTSAGRLRIVLTNQILADGVLRLVRSLGFKSSMWQGTAKISEEDPTSPSGRRLRATGQYWQVVFHTTEPMFRLERKRSTQERRVKESARAGYHYIESITPIESEPAQCLTVDSPDHTFVVGQGIRTHNTGSDFSSVARMTDGRSYSLDELSQADGVFDALRFARSMDTAVEDAASVLIQVNPWGTTEAAKRWEPLLMAALRYGVSSGARSTMKALRIALADGAAPEEMVAAVERVYGASPMFQALCGEDDSTPPLSAAEGLTYIKVGNNALNLPEPGALDPTLPQRVAMAMVRNIVYGSMSALQGREGVILLDEAWVFLSAGASEMQRLGRLARSMRVFPVMFTQRVSDALDAGLAGYISRGLILPITDRDEAVAACELFRLQATDERINRITAKAFIGDSGSESGAPNWDSMRALIDPVTRQVLRGTIGIYADVKGRAVPTQVVIPPDFLAEISTNRLDELARRRRQSSQNSAEFDRVEVAPVVSVFDDDELEGW